jgi:hypothetical protein
MSQSTNQSVLPDENSRIEVREIDPEIDIPTFEFEVQHRDDKGTWTGVSRYTLHLNELTVGALDDLAIGLHKAATEIAKLAESKIVPAEIVDEGGYDNLEELTE